MEFALKERAIRGEGGGAPPCEWGGIDSPSHPHRFEYRSRSVEKRTNVPEVRRIQVHLDGPHSAGVTGDKVNRLWHVAIRVDGDVDGVGL